MAFYRVGEVVASGREPALIGLALKTPDLDATVAQMRLCGGPVADPKPAVQGGRIASVRGDHLNWGPRGWLMNLGSVGKQLPQQALQWWMNPTSRAGDCMNAATPARRNG